ncbi:MAG: large conductance mechanosensitive channel protein MscL [Anaerolineae bacterium]|nr:large conductance mechanosensitive channel protein MscL [Anaerolineae bacterium]
MWQEFKKFILRGNVLDMAVGIIIGGAFNQIVTSLVNDVLMPPVGLLLGRVNFGDLFINLSGGTYESLAKAQEAGAATINYGMFINHVLSFLIVAFVMFLIVREVNRLREKATPPAPPAAPTTKACPYCYSQIHIQATRCPQCTSVLEE